MVHLIHCSFGQKISKKSLHSSASIGCVAQMFIVNIMQIASNSYIVVLPNRKGYTGFRIKWIFKNQKFTKKYKAKLINQDFYEGFVTKEFKWESVANSEFLFVYIQLHIIRYDN